MDRHAAGAAVPRVEMQDILDPSLDRLDQSERPAAFALAGERRHDVADFVADERLRAPVEDGQEQAVATFAVGYRGTVLVDDLDEGVVLEEMLAPERAF